MSDHLAITFVPVTYIVLMFNFAIQKQLQGLTLVSVVLFKCFRNWFSRNGWMKCFLVLVNQAAERLTSQKVVVKKKELAILRVFNVII